MCLVEMINPFLGCSYFGVNWLFTPIPVVIMGDLVFPSGTTLDIVDVHYGDDIDAGILSQPSGIFVV